MTENYAAPRSAVSSRLMAAAFGMLLALCFVLPLFEVPKNLLLAALAMVLMAQLASRREALSKLDVALIALVAATSVSTVANLPFDNAGKGIKDVVSQLVVGMVVMRAGLSRAQIDKLAIVATLGTLCALVWGVAQVLGGGRRFLELNSVGVASQSAIYIGMVALIAWGRLIDAASAPRARLGWLVALLILMLGLMASASLGAILGVMVATVVTGLATPRGRRMLAGLIVTAALSAAVVFSLPDVFLQQRLAEKVTTALSGKGMIESDHKRLAIWRVAMRHSLDGGHVMLGLGPRNFASVNGSELHRDIPLVFSDGTLHLGHAHNLLLNKLVEEGVVGLASLLAYFAVVAGMLWRARRDGGDWLWTASAGALLVPLIGGLFNTPWWGEHTLLAAIWFGLLAQQARGRRM